MDKEILRLIVALHKDEDRQGPGTKEATLRAMNCIPPLAAGGEGLRILDAGSGSGGQTLTLAKNSRAEITAVDIMPEFVAKLRERAEAAGLAARITARVGDMAGLGAAFEAGSFDCIWCEGALYHLGVEKALAEWDVLLKPGGFMAFTDLCWLANERPSEVEDFWKVQYPGMVTADARLEQIAASAYTLVDSFVLPDEAWLSYYMPLAQKAGEFLAEHAGESAAQEIIMQGQEELNMYLRFKEYYGYVFFIIQKERA